MDLAYGNALYHLFQDEKLAAITQLTAAKEKGLLKNNPNDADLLLASLYFDYGLGDKAENIFSQLLDDNVAASVKNRVWFNLARVQYEFNNFAQAKLLLSKISENLSPHREAEKQHILTNLHLQDSQFDRAVSTTSSIPTHQIWRAYSEYNLGTALTVENRSGQEESEQGKSVEGHEWLKQLLARGIDGNDKSDKELLTLQDAARLVLGLSLLRQNKLDEALVYFGEIRVSGALSNKALLATGWAWSKKSEPEKALTYWNALLNKGQVDDASLEASLAIAYAFEQLENKVVAAQHYHNAALRYEQHLQKMDGSIANIKHNDLITTLQTGTDFVEKSLDSSLYAFDAIAYMQHIVTSKSFQQAMQNYKELLEMRRSLSRWKESLPVLELMLAERSKSFESKRPLVAQAADYKQLEIMQQQVRTLAEDVQRIKNSGHDLALANEDEADYLEQLEQLEILFTKMEGQRDLSEEKEKHRLLYGLIYWDVSTDYPRRFWRLSHQLQLLESALEKTEASARSLRQAASLNEKKLADFNQRIIGQDSEIKNQQSKVAVLISRQEELINRLAIQAIEKRKKQLVQLRLNARYSLARVHDEISKQQAMR